MKTNATITLRNGSMRTHPCDDQEAAITWVDECQTAGFYLIPVNRQGRIALDMVPVRQVVLVQIDGIPE